MEIIHISATIETRLIPIITVLPDIFYNILGRNLINVATATKLSQKIVIL